MPHSAWLVAYLCYRQGTINSDCFQDGKSCWPLQNVVFRPTKFVQLNVLIIWTYASKNHLLVGLAEENKKALANTKTFWERLTGWRVRIPSGRGAKSAPGSDSRLKLGTRKPLTEARGLWERLTGIEPAYQAWEACALPLSYSRASVNGLNLV